ncbi:MFS transporter [Mammaliicoccus sciuri]|uniref:MFS transporter n=1 Tax=Mammaliicoccus sciuri TaxID=1296 RepID=UPI002436486F|nr:MFS transporter [Mammaliicoccus sciuri]
MLFWQKWNIYLILSIIMVCSFFQAIDTIQRNALIQSFVTPDKLHKAISLNALILNIARLTGPFIGGILLAQLNSNIVLSLPIIGSLMVMLFNQTLPEVHHEKKTRHKNMVVLKTTTCYCHAHVVQCLIDAFWIFVYDYSTKHCR